VASPSASWLDIWRQNTVVSDSCFSRAPHNTCRYTKTRTTRARGRAGRGDRPTGVPAGSSCAMEPDDAFLDALLSPTPRNKAKLRVPGQPPPSTDGELTAELRTSGASAAGSVEIQQPSTGWSATVMLPVGEPVDVDSLAVQRSKRSGTVYLRYEVLVSSTVSTSAPVPALEPEPEPQQDDARAAAFRQARANKLTASQQAATKSAASEQATPSAGDTPTAVATAQYFAAGADALRASDGSDTEELQLWRRRFLRGVSAATRAVRTVPGLAICVPVFALVLFTGFCTLANLRLNILFFLRAPAIHCCRRSQQHSQRSVLAQRLAQDLQCQTLCHLRPAKRIYPVPTTTKVSERCWWRKTYSPQWWNASEAANGCDLVLSCAPHCKQSMAEPQ
jgi:hypothetical protein